jgi:fatty-acyl-CoA synthase
LFGYGIFQPGGQGFARNAWDRGLPIHGIYGSSELQALLSVQPATLPMPERVNAGGRLVSNEARARARDSQMGAVLPPGGAGELEIKSARSAFTGYLDDPSATTAAIDEDGYFRTTFAMTGRSYSKLASATRCGSAASS